MSAAEDLEWNKAHRLHVAGAVAPRIRSQDDRTKSRRVARVDADGKVVGWTTLGEVQKALLLAREIELEVQPDTRPKECPVPAVRPHREGSGIRGTSDDVQREPLPATEVRRLRRHRRQVRSKACEAGVRAEADPTTKWPALAVPYMFCG